MLNHLQGKVEVKLMGLSNSTYHSLLAYLALKSIRFVVIIVVIIIFIVIIFLLIENRLFSHATNVPGILSKHST